MSSAAVTLFLFFLAYFLLLTAYYAFCGLIALFEVHRRARQHVLEDYTILSESAFTLPVSILMPAHNEEDWILDSVKSALQQEYPEVEIIVIDDGSTDTTLSILDKEFSLKPISDTIGPNFSYGTIKQIFKSDKDSRLKVISKTSGFKKAGALNAGVALAKYPYVCVADADTILETDALPKVMAHIIKDPENIVGAGGYFGLVNGCVIKEGRIIDHQFSFNPILAYQNLEYLRSFISMRSAWSWLNATPIIAGGFSIWRKDILIETGGFSPEFSSEDLEITFRIRDHMVKGNLPYRIIALPYYVGWTEGPATRIDLIRQRNRWQRCMLEAITTYKHAIGNPRYGNFGLSTLPYFLLYESLGTFFEIASIALTLLGCIAGFLSFGLLLALFVLMSLSQTMILLVSLYVFVRDQKVFKPRMIAYLIFLSFIELFWYRWLISIAKIAGTLDFLRGKKQFDRYDRQKRQDA
jgi:biofilm PGA synthesis N-glycosyltransferase PgaC